MKNKLKVYRAMNDLTQEQLANNLGPGEDLNPLFLARVIVA